MMKRIVSLTLVVLMVAALFVGCGSSKPEGTYKVKTMNGKEPEAYYREEIQKKLPEGTELTDELFKKGLEEAGLSADKLDEYMTLVFENDTVKLLAMGVELGSGTWKQDGEKLTLTMKSENEEKADSADCTFKDGEITMDMGDEEDPMKIVFAKAETK